MPPPTLIVPLPVFVPVPIPIPVPIPVEKTGDGSLKPVFVKKEQNVFVEKTKVEEDENVTSKSEVEKQKEVVKKRRLSSTSSEAISSDVTQVRENVFREQNVLHE